MHTSKGIFEYLDGEMKKGGLSGKLVFAYTDQKFFLIRFQVDGSESIEFLECLNTLFKWEGVTEFYLAFHGYIEEEEEAILMVSGSQGTETTLSQWNIERDSSGYFTGFNDTYVTEFQNNTLNLLRSTESMSVQRAEAILSEAKKNKAKFIIVGL